MLNSLSFCLSVKLLISPYTKKRRGRKETEVARRINGGIKRRERNSASNQFSKCSPQSRTHKGVPIKTTADLSIGTLEVRGNEKYTTKITLSARISFRYEGKIKSFTEKEKLREFATNQILNKC